MKPTLRVLDEFENNMCRIMVTKDKVIFQKTSNFVEDMELTTKEAINLLNELIDLIKEESE